MSPERNIQERRRIRERRRKAQEKRFPLPKVTTTEDRVRFFAIPSWEKMEGILRIRTHNNPEFESLPFNDLSVRDKGVVREHYDAMFDMATGRGTDKRDQFVQDYTGDPNSKKYNPDLIDSLGSHLRIVTETLVPSTRPRR